MWGNPGPAGAFERGHGPRHDDRRADALAGGSARDPFRVQSPLELPLRSASVGPRRNPCSHALCPRLPRRRGLPDAPGPTARHFGRRGRPVSGREDLRGTRGGGEAMFSPPGSRLYDVRRPAPIPRRRSPRFRRPEPAPGPAGGDRAMPPNRDGPPGPGVDDFLGLLRSEMTLRDPFSGGAKGLVPPAPGPPPGASRLTEGFALVDDLLAGEHTAGRTEEMERRSRDGGPDCGAAAPREL